MVNELALMMFRRCSSGKGDLISDGNGLQILEKKMYSWNFSGYIQKRAFNYLEMDVLKCFNIYDLKND